MNAKYPDAYGTCYRTATDRIIGVRGGFSSTWYVGYMDGASRRKGYPFCKAAGPDPAKVQAELDKTAAEKGWEVTE